MSADKKTTASVPFWIALLCIVILCGVLAFSVLTSGPGTAPYLQSAQQPAAATGFPGYSGASSLALPGSVCPSVIGAAPVTPPATEALDRETLVMARPPAADRVNYTDRGFSEPVEASVAWWMSPGFMDNTTEFRGYERTTAGGKSGYPEEHRVFFTFIEHSLDTAEQQSTLMHGMTLFRGINPSVAGTVLNTSEYREPAFASTSYDITFSLDAFGLRSPDGYRNMLVLRRDPGDHALYINEDEREYLLPRGMTWSVVKVENVQNLSVNADFPLHNRTTNTTSFDHVRLIYITGKSCA
ncbi:MAG: hypothetical protein ABSG49_10090 [Methanoregula sp.]|jgi:hypothetical protein|uniref:hypothetical protein n=1 Tax=Methanoregula sp. TaxID=2052170 RepID=UPI003C223F78